MKTDTIGVRLSLNELERIKRIADDYCHTSSTIARLLIERGLNEYDRARERNTETQNLSQLLGIAEASTESN